MKTKWNIIRKLFNYVLKLFIAKNVTGICANDMQMKVSMRWHVIPAIFKTPTAPKQTYGSRTFLLCFHKISLEIVLVLVYLFTRKHIK